MFLNARPDSAEHHARCVSPEMIWPSAQLRQRNIEVWSRSSETPTEAIKSIGLRTGRTLTPISLRIA